MRYPKPSSYRNPYVDVQAGRPFSSTFHPLRPNSYKNIYCSKRNTVELIRELVTTTNYHLTLRDIADNVGVTYQRVQQIIHQHNIPWQSSKIQFEWECPGCGNWIKVNRSTWQYSWQYMPAHCRTCSKEHQAKFCIRGHLRDGNTNSSGGCRPCMNLKDKCIMEIRTCKICQQPLKISYAHYRQLLQGNGVGQYHVTCWGRLAKGQKTHCKRGHEFTSANIYTYKGKRHCRTCVQRRAREKYWRDKNAVPNLPATLQPN